MGKSKIIITELPNLTIYYINYSLNVWWYYV